VEIKQRGPVRMSVADHDAQDVAELRQAGVNTKPAEKDVLPGIRTVKARLQKHGDGRPRLYIHPRCVNLLREIGMYVWDESPSGATKERPRKENDHAMDALRYLCMAVDNARTPKVWWL
jgi:phage terminase large subunit